MNPRMRPNQASSQASSQAYLINPKGSRDDHGTEMYPNLILTNQPPAYHSTSNQPVYQPSVIYQPAANQSQIKNVGLCDCNGSYCKYCWLGMFMVFPCTSPYVWYKITKALNMGNLVKAVLAFTILYAVFIVMRAPMEYNTPRVPTIHYKCRF